MKEYEIEKKKAAAHISSLKHDGNTNHIQSYNDHIFTTSYMVYFFLLLIHLFWSAYSNDGQGIFTNLYTVYVCLFLSYT